MPGTPEDCCNTAMAAIDAMLDDFEQNNRSLQWLHDRLDEIIDAFIACIAQVFSTEPNECTDAKAATAETDSHAAADTYFSDHNRTAFRAALATIITTNLKAGVLACFGQGGTGGGDNG